MSNLFRVMCRRANGNVSLVAMFPTLTAAVVHAKLRVDRHLKKLRFDRSFIVSDPSRPSEVYVERWVGSLLEGSWEVVNREDGGYFFLFLDRAPRSHQNSNGLGNGIGNGIGNDVKKQSQTIPGRVQSGDIVLCELLAKRTKKGGWFARIVKQSVSGPITNSGDVPSHYQAGHQLRLRLCGIKVETGFAQFAWVENGQLDQGKKG
jgi:hypothetical protein